MQERTSALVFAIAGLSCVACSALVPIPDLTGGSEEAGGDAAVASDAAPSTACAPGGTTLFCATFDEDPAVEYGWTTYSPMAGAPLTLATTDAFSPPRSLRAAASTDAVRSTLERALGPVPARITVTFAVWPDSSDPRYAEVARLAVGPQTFRFRVTGPSASLHHKYTPAGGSEIDDKLLEVSLPSRVWTRVTIELDFRAKTHRTRFGEEVKSAGALGYVGPPGEAASLVVGVVSLEAGFASGVFHLDDIVVAVPPD